MEPSCSESAIVHRILVLSRQDNGQRYLQSARQLGIEHLEACRAGRLIFLQGALQANELQAIAESLLVDPVVETWSVGNKAADFDHFIEVTLHSGVTDPPAENLVRAAHRLGITGLHAAASGWRYELQGQLSITELQRLAQEIFANPVIQHTAVDKTVAPPFVAIQAVDETVEIIPLRQATAEELLAISRDRRLALDLAEMQAIRTWYAGQKRDPTDVELETLAQTWSEHCVHKTFKAHIDYRGPDGQIEHIDGLLKSYIRAATEKVDKPWVRSAFVDNAGIIAFDETHDLAFKLETHNHPSALEPFGGANTGIGGVVRDVLGVSARPIANTDILCFGPPDTAPNELPQGVLHPARVADGVVLGIEDYGNKMGIPTVNGAVLYHPGYTANPLVYCGCLGILPHGSHPTEPRAGDLVVAIGGRTGRDGLRGATFSSMEMDVGTGEIAGTAVQIGNPIMEKQVQEVILRARDEQLYTAITDCGAGGFSSAVGEMGAELGAEVQLQAAKLKYPGLRPWEIWLSEAQERMVLAVPPHNWQRLQDICAGQDVEALKLGSFTGDGRLRIYYGVRLVGDLATDFLHNGLPRKQLQAEWQQTANPTVKTATATPAQTPGERLLALLKHPDIRSKEAIIRRYDHEVQGGTAIKPLTGAANQGPSDAAVLVPQHAQKRDGKAVALANGICPNYTAYDPYRMAWAAVDEAFRNITAVGADPDQVALLDNFCWGNPNLPDRLGALVRCAQGCYEAAVSYNAPFVSGKDSLNNEYTGADGQKHAIPGTLLISSVSILPDVNEAVTMDWKGAGNFIFVVGDTSVELGGSHYQQIGGEVHEQHDVAPRPVSDGLARMRALHRAMRAGLVQSCHDCSEGEVAVALAEMSLAGSIGAEVELHRLPRHTYAAYADDEAILFSETLSRFVVEVCPDDAAQFTAILDGISHGCIGVTGGQRLRVTAMDANKYGKYLIDLPVVVIANAWSGQELTPQKIERAASTKQVERTSGAPALRGSPTVLILHANGTNRDRDAAIACEMAGGKPEIVHVNQILAGARRLDDYRMLVVPGGFSYGDDLGAGVLWAQDLQWGLGEALARFVAGGRPVLGICNGFQALVKAGILPGIKNGAEETKRKVTLTFNENGRFECRWVWLETNPSSPSLFTQAMPTPLYCPVAHGEGRLVVKDQDTLAVLQSRQLIPLTYAVAPGATRAGMSKIGYPANPNGSVLNAAALCNEAGNVLGLMPHPENHIFPWQNPSFGRGQQGHMGLALFRQGIKHA